MTYRDRREARADRLEEWAGKREAKAEVVEASARQLADQIPFGQPILVGHHSEGHARRDAERIYSRTAKAYEHSAKADEMARKAANIRAAADRSIYSDDEDAIERLEERIAALEAKRDQHKAENAAYRKEHAAALKAMTPYDRKLAVPHPYSTNLAADIRRNKQRLERLSGTTQATPKQNCPKCSSENTRWFRRRFECWGCGHEWKESEKASSI